MKTLRILALAIGLILLWSPSKAYASIDSPTSYSISAVTAYSPALEANDILFIVQFNITYAVNPSTDAGDAWLLRLLYNGVEVASASPYPYYNSGYAPGTASFYLPAADSPVWSGNYTVSLEPNPTLDWTSIPSQSLFAAITWSSASTFDTVATALGTQIRAIAIGFNTSWSATANPLIESVNGILKLTSRGEGYFDVVIPYLRTIQPNLYQAGLNNPVIVNNNYGNSYQTQADANLVGTPLDPTNMATSFGLSRMWATGLLWFGFAVLVAGLVGYYSQTTKPSFFLFGGIMIAGGFMGFGLLQTVLFGLLGAASVILAFAWKGA